MNDNEPARIRHNAALLPQLIAANTAGDHQTAQRIIQQMQPSADLLLMLYESYGEEGIEGMDTKEAECVFGANWKECRFDELVSKLHV